MIKVTVSTLVTLGSEQYLGNLTKTISIFVEIEQYLAQFGL